MFRTMFGSWIAGTMFMFHFANFMSMLRKHARPGLFWFIRDIDDEDLQNDPVKDMLQKPLVVVLPKIVVSFFIYLMLAWFLLWPLYLSVVCGWVDFRVMGYAGTYLPADSDRAQAPSNNSSDDANLAFGYLEWVVVYWALYLIALKAVQPMGVTQLYRTCIARLFDRCVFLFRLRSVVYGGFWPEDVSDWNENLWNSVDYREDGVRDAECSSEESFMLVLAQDKFVDIDIIKEIYHIDDVKPPEKLEFDIAVHQSPGCDPALIQAGYPLKPEFTPLRFTVAREQRFKIPILSSIRSWRDPIRIKMTYDEYKRLIGIRYTSGTAVSDKYDDGMFSFKLDLDKKPPVIVNVSVKYASKNGDDATVKGTIVYKPRHLYASVAKLVFTFLLSLSLAHYTLFFGLLWLGRFFIGVLSYSISLRWFKPSDVGSLLAGIALFLSLSNFVITPLLKFSREHCRHRNLVFNYLQGNRNLNAEVELHRQVFIEGDLSSSLSGLGVSKFHEENALRIFAKFNRGIADDKYIRNIRMECNLDRFAFIPVYWNDSFVSGTKSLLELLFSSLAFVIKWVFLLSALAVFIPVLSSEIFRTVIMKTLDFMGYMYSIIRKGFTRESIVGVYRVESLNELINLHETRLSGIFAKIIDTVLYPYQLRQLLRFFQATDFTWVRDTYVPFYDFKWDQISVKSTAKLALAVVAGGMLISLGPMVAFGLMKHIVLPLFAVFRLNYDNVVSDVELLTVCDRILIPGLLISPALKWMLRGLLYLKDAILNMILKSECLETKEIMDMDEAVREQLRRESLSSQPSPTSPLANPMDRDRI